MFTLIFVPAEAKAQEEVFDLPLESLLDIEITSVSKSAERVSEAAADLQAGQATLDNIAWLPAVLIILFGILYFFRNKLEEIRLPHSGH